MIRLICTFIIIFALSQLVAAQQRNKSCYQSLEYLTDIAPYSQTKFTLVGGNGRAIDAFYKPVVNLCVTLYSSAQHRFIAKAVTNKKGYFHFNKTASGEYRLIARIQNVDGACGIVAHVQIKKKSARYLTAHKRLVLHMRVAGLNDIECSYVEMR